MLSTRDIGRLRFLRFAKARYPWAMLNIHSVHRFPSKFWSLRHDCGSAIDNLLYRFAHDKMTSSRSTLVTLAYAEVAFGVTNVAIGLCLYVRRRHLFPIHARHVPLVVLSVVRDIDAQVVLWRTCRVWSEAREPRAYWKPLVVLSVFQIAVSSRCVLVCSQIYQHWSSSPAVSPFGMFANRAFILKLWSKVHLASLSSLEHWQTMETDRMVDSHARYP